MPPPESQADRVSTLLKQRIKAVFRQLPRALAGEAEAVHQVRVAGRRLRVGLPLLARKPRGRRVKRALAVLRGLTRSAGTSRDLDVTVGLLAQRVRALRPPSPEQRRLLRRLRAARARSRARMVEALLDLEIARLRRNLRAIVSRGAADVFTVMARVRGLRDRQGEALLAGFAAIGDRYDPEGLHALRGRVRRLRYTAELSGAIRGEESGVPALWKKLQDQIGLLHDHHVLAAWLESQARSAAAAGNPALAEQARAEQAFFLEAGRGLHQALLEEPPAERVARALEAMGGGAPRPRLSATHG